MLLAALSVSTWRCIGDDHPSTAVSSVSPLDIAPELRALQRGTVHRVRTATGDEAWLVIDYAQVRRLLADDRLGRSHPDPEKPRVAESALFGNPVGNFETEASDHAQMRELLQPHFSPRHLHALAPRVEELTTALLDERQSRVPPLICTRNWRCPCRFW